MQASKQLRKPRDWQAFEDLCKRLWGEIWDCPEIKKNGRQGQNQCGVDIYGIPSFDNDYYGIQCKGKDENLNAKLSYKEIDREIGKALKFEPKLKKFYITTTSEKDVKLEEYVRKKNIEHKLKNLFEVHLFSWEDIVDLIDQNPNTKNFYEKSQNYKQQYSCELTFHDGSKELTLTLPFRKSVTYYYSKNSPLFSENSIFKNVGFSEAMIRQQKLWDQIEKNHKQWEMNFPNFGNKRKINRSVGIFSFVLYNTGQKSINDFKIIFEIEGEYHKIDLYENIKYKEESDHIGLGLDFNSRIKPLTIGDSGGVIVSHSKLVGGDVRKFAEIGIVPQLEPKTLKIHWKLLADDFNDQGELILHLVPDIKQRRKSIEVENPDEVRKEEGEVEYYYENEK